MKKSRILCVALLAVVVLLSGCDDKPSDISDTAYRAGNKAVSIVEQYLNMDITQAEAYQQLDSVLDRMDAVDDSKTNAHDMRISSAIMSLQSDLSPNNAKTAAGIEDALEDDVEKLKDLLAY